MNSAQVIQKAILSEKAYSLMDKGIYTFLIDKRAGKAEVAKAVKKQFSVDVKKVNISSFAPKQKRIQNTRKTVTVGGGKKAIVWLASGQTIELLTPKSEKKKKNKKESKEKNDK